MKSNHFWVKWVDKGKKENSSIRSSVNQKTFRKRFRKTNKVLSEHEPEILKFGPSWKCLIDDVLGQ